MSRWKMAALITSPLYRTKRSSRAVAPCAHAGLARPTTRARRCRRRLRGCMTVPVGSYGALLQYRITNLHNVCRNNICHRSPNVCIFVLNLNPNQYFRSHFTRVSPPEVSSPFYPSSWRISCSSTDSSCICAHCCQANMDPTLLCVSTLMWQRCLLNMKASQMTTSCACRKKPIAFCTSATIKVRSIKIRWK